VSVGTAADAPTSAAVADELRRYEGREAAKTTARRIAVFATFGDSAGGDDRRHAANAMVYPVAVRRVRGLTEGVDLVPRTDIAAEAIANLEAQGLEVKGESWQRVEVELVEGGA
jgi:hypothetical protein